MPVALNTYGEHMNRYQRTLVKHAHHEGRLRDRARGIAEEHLRKLSAEQLLRENIQGILRGVRIKVTAELIPLARSAFRHGKQAAWTVISQIPPKSKTKKVAKEMNEAEKEYLRRSLANQDEPFQVANAVFVLRLSSWINQMKARDMKPEAIESAVSLDWNKKTKTGTPGGRTCGEWQREFINVTEEVVGSAYQAGEYCGYHGVGHETE